MSAINWSGNVKHSDGKFPLNKSDKEDFHGTLAPSAWSFLKKKKKKPDQVLIQHCWLLVIFMTKEDI